MLAFCFYHGDYEVGGAACTGDGSDHRGRRLLPLLGPPTPVLQTSDEGPSKLTGSLKARRQLSNCHNTLFCFPMDKGYTSPGPLRRQKSALPRRPLTKQVGPDVAGLRVDAEDAPEAGPEGGHGRPVAVQQVVVVLQPVGEHVVGDDPPATLPDLEPHAPSAGPGGREPPQDKG